MLAPRILFPDAREELAGWGREWSPGRQARGFWELLHLTPLSNVPRGLSGLHSVAFSQLHVKTGFQRQDPQR